MTSLRITSDGNLRSIGDGDVRAVDASGSALSALSVALTLAFAATASPSATASASVDVGALGFTATASPSTIAGLRADPLTFSLQASPSGTASADVSVDVIGFTASASPKGLVNVTPEPVGLALSASASPSAGASANANVGTLALSGVAAPSGVASADAALGSLVFSAAAAPAATASATVDLGTFSFSLSGSPLVFAPLHGTLGMSFSCSARIAGLVQGSANVGTLSFTATASPRNNPAAGFRNLWLDVYSARQALLNAIDADNRARAEDAMSAVEDEASLRLIAVNAAITTAAADATAKVNAAKAILDASIAVLNGQVADITGADVWDSGKAYPEGDLVRDGGTPEHLYRAIQAVPAGTALTNTAYWEFIGNYSSLGEAVSATAATVAANTTALESAASSLAVIVARMPTGTDTLANEARVAQAEAAAATATSAVSTALSALSAAVNDADTGLAAKAQNDDLAATTARINDTGDGKSIEVVASDLAALGIAISDPTTGLAAKASLSALNEVSGDLDTVSGTVGTHTTQIAAANSAIEGKASQDSLDTTNTNVSANTGAITAHGERLDTLEGSVNDATTGLTARALNSEYQSTKTQVDTNTGAISAQATQLNTVKASIGESPDNLVKKSTFGSDLSIGQWSAGSVVPNGGLHASQPYLMAQSGNAYENVTFPVTPGDQYDITIDVHTANVTSSYAAVGIQTFTSDGTPDFAQITDSTKAGFHTLTGRVTIPAGAVVGVPIVNLSGAIYWTQFRIERVSTAAKQNASATTLLDARVGVTEDGLAIAQAAWGFQLDVNGYTGGAYALNDGTIVKLLFNMDEVTFTSATGNGTSIAGGIIIQRKGGYMVVNGPGFGASGELLEWFGPDMPVGDCTTANAISYKTTSGDIPAPPPAPTGTEIKFNTSSESTSSTNTLQLVNNNTAGASKTVTANYYFRSSYQSVSDTITDESATVSLWRKVGAGSFVQLGSTQSVTLNDMVEAGAPHKWRHTLEGACSLVVTDTDTSLSDHTYEWRLTSRSASAGADAIQTMTIKTLET